MAKNGLLRMETCADLATAIAQTWNGPNASVWEDVLASHDVDVRIGEITYRRLRDEIESRTLVPAAFVARYVELHAIAMSERTPDVGPCARCQGSPGWREITDDHDPRFHGPACTWLSDLEHGRPTVPECACRPVVVPRSCPLGERAKVQHAAIQRRRAVRNAGADPTPAAPDARRHTAHVEEVPLPPEPPPDEFDF